MSLSTAKAVKVSELQFDNRNLRNLPLDPKPFSLDDSRSVPNAIWAKVNLQPTENPRLVAYSEDALALLGIDKSQYEDETALEADIEKYVIDLGIVIYCLEDYCSILLSHKEALIFFYHIL